MGKEQLFVIGGIFGSLVLIVAGAVVFNNVKFGGDPSKLLTRGRGVHWHAQMSASVCGKEIDWSQYKAGTAMPPIHTHGDAKAHMESIFKTKEDITVRKFLQYTGIPVSENGIFEKADGTPCNNEATQSARFYGTVNDQEVADILDYPMHDPNQPNEQEDKIRLVYE